MQESEGLISISDEPVKPITLATVEGDSDYPYALQDGEDGYFLAGDKKLNLASDTSDKKSHVSITVD